MVSHPKVFTDASSAILLYKAGLFKGIYRTVSIVLARSVFSEITRPGYKGAGFFSLYQNLVSCLSPAPTPLDPAGIRSLDPGERDTIRIYLQHRKQASSSRLTGFILVDDGRAARLCQTHDYPFINALLVPKVLCYSGRLTPRERDEKMAFLSRQGRYSDQIIQRAHAFSAQDLRYFTQGIANGK